MGLEKARGHGGLVEMGSTSEADMGHGLNGRGSMFIAVASAMLYGKEGATNESCSSKTIGESARVVESAARKMGSKKSQRH